MLKAGLKRPKRSRRIQKHFPDYKMNLNEVKRKFCYLRKETYEGKNGTLLKNFERYKEPIIIMLDFDKSIYTYIYTQIKIYNIIEFISLIM